MLIGTGSAVNKTVLGFTKLLVVRKLTGPSLTLLAHHILVLFLGRNNGGKFPLSGN